PLGLRCAPRSPREHDRRPARPVRPVHPALRGPPGAGGVPGGGAPAGAQASGRLRLGVDVRRAGPAGRARRLRAREPLRLPPRAADGPLLLAGRLQPGMGVRGCGPVHRVAAGLEPARPGARRPRAAHLGRHADAPHARRAGAPVQAGHAAPDPGRRAHRPGAHRGRAAPGGEPVGALVPAVPARAAQGPRRRRRAPRGAVRARRPGQPGARRHGLPRRARAAALLRVPRPHRAPRGRAPDRRAPHHPLLRRRRRPGAHARRRDLARRARAPRPRPARLAQPADRPQTRPKPATACRHPATGWEQPGGARPTRGVSSPGQLPRSAMRPTYLRTRFLLVLLPLLSLLACDPSVTEVEATSIEVAPLYLSFDGTSEATLSVTANGSWTLTSDASWLKVSQSSGRGGSSTVRVTVDRSGLPAQQHAGRLKLSGSGRSVTVHVSMRFPHVTGTVVDPTDEIKPGSLPRADALQGA